MRTPCPNPFENLLAVEVHAPKLWVASAHLNGRAAAELFPLEGGASTTVCTASGLAHHMAELGILTLEELHDVPVRTDWRIGYVLSWVRRFGVEVNLRSIIAVMPPVTADTDALNPRGVFDSILEAVPAPGYSQLIERIQANVRGDLGDAHVRSVLVREGFILQEPTALSCGYLIGDVMES